MVDRKAESVLLDSKQSMTCSPLLVFADDWGRHPSSCQHIIRRMAQEHDVLWVNTIGTRSPKFDFATFTRGMEKVLSWSGRRKDNAPAPARLRVINPLMWPSFKSQLARSVNRRLLTAQLSEALQRMPGPISAITTLPITADLVGNLQVANWTYYCVDDFGEWPGLDRDVLHHMERKLVERVDNIIVVSETLKERITKMGRSSTLLTHGVDLLHWNQSNLHPSSEVAAQLESLPRPIVAFWGVIDRRLDLTFLAKLCSDLEHGTVLLIGPEDNSLAHDLPRLVKWGPLTYEMLPAIARQVAVLVMPYADLPVTRAMQPLKLKEYMATGKPVVVRNLPACQEWRECLDLADTPEVFSTLVQKRIFEGVPATQTQARDRLKTESWDSKALQFKSLVFRNNSSAECRTSADAVYS